MLTLVGFLAALTLLGISAFFSASETALVSLSPQKAKRLALQTPSLAKDLTAWLSRPQELLTLILVGNTLATVLFAAVLTTVSVHAVDRFTDKQVELVSWLAGLVLMVIFGDMAPKIFARSSAEKTSLLVLPFLARIRLVCQPVMRLLSALLALVFPKLKTPPFGQIFVFSLEELKSLLEEGGSGAVVSDESVGMMKRVLEINNRRVADIMTPLGAIDMVEIDPEGRPSRDRDRLFDMIIENGHTRTPVKQRGRIIGFIHSDDLLSLILHDRGLPIPRLVRRPVSVGADQPVSEVLSDFRLSGYHAALVTNDRGETIGMVTLEDVLEEITGEILDEFDVSQPPLSEP